MGWVFEESEGGGKEFTICVIPSRFLFHIFVKGSGPHLMGLDLLPVM